MEDTDINVPAVHPLAKDPQAYVRMEALKVASAQYQRTNAVGADTLVSYAKVLEAYVNGAVNPLE